MKYLLTVLAAIVLFTSCQQNESGNDVTGEIPTDAPAQKLLSKYTTFKLSTDLSKLSDNQKEMVKLLIEAGKIMDDLFWYEAYGDKAALLESIKDEDLKKFAIINYGPWDRLDGNKPFIEGVGEKPKGANFYPTDLTDDEKKTLEKSPSQYSFVRRGDDGKLQEVPYHIVFEEKIKKASALVSKAAELADEPGLKNYLTLRAAALLNDDYLASDMAWMDMVDNQIEVVIGPIENYEDQLFGAKSAHECFVLIKDMDWSERLKKYAAFLPELQKNLPVDAKYKQDKVGGNSQLNAYDVVYYAGDCNAGSKTIAINLPNDDRVQDAKGSRRLQLKNAMRAKFDKILMPISEELITPSQRKHITFDAFFSNTMFHEVAHGLGVKYVVGTGGKKKVRDALGKLASALEEGKADILGLYMITQLHEKGELKGDLKDYYTTFMAKVSSALFVLAHRAHMERQT